MKDITKILHNGNLTAREKFILLIQNDVHKMKTGKDILTPADSDALENWKAKNNEEVREWNRLNDGWKHTGRMDIEVEFTYKDAKIMYLSQLPMILQLLYYPTYQRMEKCIDTLNNLPKVTIDYATKIATKQREIKLMEGLDFGYATYRLAFELQTENDKKRMVELYPDIETDQQYLDQEEIIADLYDGKTELTAKAKEKLASLVAGRCYNEFAKEYQLFHYFACIPIIKVARYFLKMKNVVIGHKAILEDQETDEDLSSSNKITEVMKTYAVEHNTKIEYMLKEGCLAWLNNGLTEAYTPLIISTDSELLKRWLEKKREATSLLRRYVADGKLKLRKRTLREKTYDMLYSKDLYDSESESAREMIEHIGMNITEKGETDEKKAFEKFNDSVITGESLYNFKKNYKFVKDFQTRVDKYDANLGIVHADDNPRQIHNHLDREFIISNINEKGNPTFFSMYNMSMKLLSVLFESKVFFGEFVENGKRYLKFKDIESEKIFNERRQGLIENYAKLLAFEAVFKRLSKIYEADLTYHVAERICTVRADMERFNKAVRVATNADEESRNASGIFKSKEIVPFKEDPLIDIWSIKPDISATQEHEEKLKSILGDF